MITNIFTRKNFIPTLTGLLFSLTTATSFAADDAYLNALKAEANGRSAPQKVAVNEQYLDALSAEAEAGAKIGNGNGNMGASNEVRHEMETLLKEEKPTSFKYYKKLSSKDKAKVAASYSKDTGDKKAKLDHLRHQILDLYFKR